MTVSNITEVSAQLRVGKRKIANLAREHGIGFNAGGTAGWRFTDDDVEQLVDAMRPTPADQPRPRRRQRRAVVSS